MAPVVAVNRPEMVTPDGRQGGVRPGSVGQPIPGVSAKVVDRESGAPLPAGEEGLLLVRGPTDLILAPLALPSATGSAAAASASVAPTGPTTPSTPATTPGARPSSR